LANEIILYYDAPSEKHQITKMTHLPACSFINRTKY